MIPRSVRSRLSRLEDRITDALCDKRLRGAVIEVAPVVFARMHAASVVALVRYGGVRIDEPLSRAYNRAIAKLASRYGSDIAQIIEPPQIDKQVIGKLVSLFGPEIKP